MNERAHLSGETLDRFERRLLTPAEIEEVFRHLGECRACARLRDDAVLVLDAEPVRHLELDDEMIPYVEGTLDPAGREIVESHLEDCATCRAEVEDLRASPPRRSIRPWLAVAASLLLAVLTLLLLRTDAPAPETPARPPAVRKPPAVARGYANAEWTRAVEAALASGRLPLPDDLAALQRRGGTLRGGPATENATLGPSGVVIETTRPLFTWPAADGATYSVFVFSDEEPVAQSGPLDAPRWTPPGELARGRTYEWQVEITTRDGATAIVPAAPAPPATFRIVSAREHEELEAARRAHPGDALLLAVLHARTGLLAEARAHLETLASSKDPRVQRLRQEASPRITNGAQ